MAMKNASSLVNQRGALLIELLISLVFGVLAIGLVMSILMTGYRVAARNTLELLVMQNLTITSQMIRSEILRAGYAASGAGTVQLVGASDVIEISGASVAFAYLEPGSGLYRHVKFQIDNHKLQSCEKVSPSLVSAAAIGPCFNVFDEKMLVAKSFGVSSLPLQTSKAKSTFTRVYIEAELIDGSFNHSVTTKIKQRNWL